MALVTRKTGGESMAKKTFKDKFQRFETKYIISKLWPRYWPSLKVIWWRMSMLTRPSIIFTTTPRPIKWFIESLEKPYFKEKLRANLRWKSKEDSQVFFWKSRKVRVSTNAPHFDWSSRCGGLLGGRHSRLRIVGSVKSTGWVSATVVCSPHDVYLQSLF